MRHLGHPKLKYENHATALYVFCSGALVFFSFQNPTSSGNMMNSTEHQLIAQHFVTNQSPRRAKLAEGKQCPMSEQLGQNKDRYPRNELRD